MSSDDQSLADRELERVADLPFVTATEDGLLFWQIAPTGHDETDISTGELFGVMALAVAKQQGGPMLLAAIIRDMVQGGRFGALEAGFIAQISSAARAGSMN